MRFVLAQGTHQATKANFVLLAKENCNWNGAALLFLQAYRNGKETRRDDSNPFIVIKSLFIL